VPSFKVDCASGRSGGASKRAFSLSKREGRKGMEQALRNQNQKAEIGKEGAKMLAITTWSRWRREKKFRSGLMNETWGDQQSPASKFLRRRKRTRMNPRNNLILYRKNGALGRSCPRGGTKKSGCAKPDRCKMSASPLCGEKRPRPKLGY